MKAILVNYIVTIINIKINLKRLWLSFIGRPCGKLEYLNWNPVDVFVKVSNDFGIDISNFDNKRINKLRKYCKETISVPCKDELEKDTFCEKADITTTKFLGNNFEYRIRKEVEGRWFY